MPDKLKDTLTSRRFWALVTALVATAAAFAQGKLTDWEAIIAVVGATSTYALAIGLSPDTRTGGPDTRTGGPMCPPSDAELARLRGDPPPAPLP